MLGSATHGRYLACVLNGVFPLRDCHKNAVSLHECDYESIVGQSLIRKFGWVVKWLGGPQSAAHTSDPFTLNVSLCHFILVVSLVRSVGRSVGRSVCDKSDASLGYTVSCPYGWVMRPSGRQAEYLQLGIMGLDAPYLNLSCISICTGRLRCVALLLILMAPRDL